MISMPQVFNTNKWRGKRWTPSSVKGTRLVLQANEQVHIYPTVREINSFFLIATQLLHSSKWQPIKKKVGRHFQRQTKPFFYAVIALEIKLGIFNVLQSGHQDPIWRLVIDREHVLRFGNKLNEEVCRGFTFENFLIVANLANNFQDLVAKVKNLVALAPVVGAISRPALGKNGVILNKKRGGGREIQKWKTKVIIT